MDPLQFSGSAADMLKMYGASTVPEPAPMTSLPEARAAKERMEAAEQEVREDGKPYKKCTKTGCDKSKCSGKYCQKKPSKRTVKTVKYARP